MTNFLSSEPNFEHLRKQARALQRAVRGGDAEARARVAQHHPSPPAAPTFPLSAAQLVVARECGFASWPRLAHYFDVVDRHGRRFDEAGAEDESMADRFCRLASLQNGADSPDRRAEAQALLATHPELPASSIWVAAAASDPDAVRQHLTADRSLAVREGGPDRCAPLFHLAYSRVDPDVAADRVLTVARLLLDAGADPNTTYFWRGVPSPFTVLTGVFGEGEDGPGRQPRHPHSLALARLVLEAGAEPNDLQVLYNRMFEPDDDHLVLLFEFGLGTGDGGRWRARIPEAVGSPAELLAFQLQWAAGHGFADRVRLLLAHGVPATAAAVEAATTAGCTQVVELLVAAGAPRPDLTPADLLVGAAFAGDRAAVERLRSPDVVAQAIAARPGAVRQASTVESLQLLLELGFDVDTTDAAGATALHGAAWRGRADLVQALLAAGADASKRDNHYGSTPLGWAEHGNQPAIIALLSPRSGVERVG